MLDGVSVLTTEKSIADHGISIVAQRDCAVWRGVVDGEVCREWEDDGTMVAAAAAGADGVTPPASASLRASLAAAAGSDVSDISSPVTRTVEVAALSRVDAVEAQEIDVENLDIDALANFETAAGGKSAVEGVELPTLPAPDLTLELAPAAPVAEPAKVEVARVDLVRIAVKSARIAAQTGSGMSPAAGVYFVIGSFRNRENAEVLAGRHEGFVPEVLAAKLDGAPVYRVVVGPVLSGREKTVHRTLARAGLVDTWAIRVVPGDWQLASAITGFR